MDVLAAELGGTIAALHAHFLHTPGSVARYAARLLGLPFSLSGHAKDIWTTPDWDLGEKLRGAAWTVTCSEAAAARLRALAPENPAEVIYHGLDLARFPAPDPRHAARDGHHADDPVRILAVSRAVDRALTAGTAMSGATPIPSQLVFVIGLMALPYGTQTEKWSLARRSPPPWAPPPVVSPIRVARWRCFEKASSVTAVHSGWRISGRRAVSMKN